MGGERKKKKKHWRDHLPACTVEMDFPFLNNTQNFSNEQITQPYINITIHIIAPV